MQIDLGGVEETLLVPLWGRAKFSRENPSILNDTKATELVEGLDYDFARLDKSLGVLGNLMHAARWVARLVNASHLRNSSGGI